MIIAVIPAQSKSTRLPGKNMKKLLGKPLIDYTIDYARECSLVDEVYVSTDSQEIAEYAMSKNVKSIIRPESLCGDVSIVDVIKHCVSQIPDNNVISRVVALQVDHPDRTVPLEKLLRAAIDNDTADVITIDPDGKRNGSVRIVRKNDLMADKLSYSLMAFPDYCTNIHYLDDFEKAAQIIKGGGRVNDGN